MEAGAAPGTLPQPAIVICSMNASAPTRRSRALAKAAPSTRQRISDQVFESLARSILTGELKPNGPLPTQRELARSFGSSALVVRQAIHRLEDLGLVRVRQGSTTVVLDPDQATDIRLIQLRMVLAPRGQGFSVAAIENQMLFVVPH
jgi:DNA-binding FadR family transcriptional regulator